MQGLVKVSNAFLTSTASGTGGAAAKTKMVDTTQLMASMGGANDQVNLMEMVRYLRESKLARKISGFVEMTEDEAAKKGESISPFECACMLMDSSSGRPKIGFIHLATRFHRSFPSGRGVPPVSDRCER